MFCNSKTCSGMTCSGTIISILEQVISEQVIDYGTSYSEIITHLRNLFWNS